MQLRMHTSFSHGDLNLLESSLASSVNNYTISWSQLPWQQATPTFRCEMECGLVEWSVGYVQMVRSDELKTTNTQVQLVILEWEGGREGGKEGGGREEDGVREGREEERTYVFIFYIFFVR